MLLLPQKRGPKMAISIVDLPTPEESLLLSYYKACPGATWVDAAEALRMDEDHVWTVSVRLVQTHKLTLEYHWLELSQFWPVDIYQNVARNTQGVFHEQI